MRFMVDLYRYIILFALALVLIGGTVGLLEVTTAGISSPVSLIAYAYTFFAFIIIVLVIGFVAIAVSIHDRHAELVDEVRLLRLSAQGAPDQTR